MAIAEPKIKEKKEVVEELVAQKAEMNSDGRHIKIIKRDLALVEPPMADGAWRARDLEGYIDALIEHEGWYLNSIHVIGQREVASVVGNLEPVLQMVFVLTK